MATASGIGLTTTFEVTKVPLQPFAFGVIVKVVVIGAEVKFVKDPLTVPLPLDAIPGTVPVLFLVQLKVVGLTLPVKEIGVMVLPEHIV